MTNQKFFSTKQLTLMGIMAALVCVACFFQLPITLPLGTTRIHLGNSCILLAALLLGGTRGGIAAGIGAMFFDILNPAFITGAPFTLVFRFLMAFVCGKIAYANGKNGLNNTFNIIGVVVGTLLYMVLYLSKSYITAVYFSGAEVETAIIDTLQKAGLSSVNAVLGIVSAIPLAIIIRQSMPQIFKPTLKA